MRMLTALLAGFLTGCASTPTTEAPSPLSPNYRTLTSGQLWQTLTSSVSTREVMIAEAELATRGEAFSGGEYLGRRTAGTVGVAQYARSATNVADRNCSDFSSSAEAQRFFLSAGGPFSDPHGLDRDGDGNACEFGQALRASAARYRLKPVAATRLYAPQVTSSQCFTGPRGGTYTITASGNKNYGGC